LLKSLFSEGMLEYPQYTRPRNYKGFKVPEVLVSGDPKKISAWQKTEALKKTESVRPDLLEKIKRSN
jgi:tRNA (guanine37-N1)-methyltransferase